MRSTVFLLSTAAVLGFPLAASAQNTSVTGGGTTVAQSGLEEIVVTAQRREESAQRAAVAISVLGGDTLRDNGIVQLNQLNDLIPALSVQQTSTGNLIFIRGVGNFTVTPNSDPATAFNYDGVYIGRFSATGGLFFDLQRVEVLKGPQGTLYGRNATAGAINLLPVQPILGKLSGYGAATYGNYNTLNLEAGINVPMGENGALRVSGLVAQRDGFTRDGTNDQRDRSVRVQYKAELTPDLTVRAAVDYAKIGGTGTSVSYFGAYDFNPRAGNYIFRAAPTDAAEGIFTPASQAFRQTLPAGPAGRRLTPLDITPFQDNEFFGATGEINWRTDVGTLTVIPAWRYGNEDYLSSAGGFAYGQRQKNEQFSLEARFAGERVGIFDYIVGAFYFDETLKFRTALSLGAAANFLESRYNTKSFAPFARVTANISDRMRIVGGARYTEDRKSFQGLTTGNTIVCLNRVMGVPTCPTVPLFPYFQDISQSPIPLPGPNGVRPIIVNGVPTGAIISRSDRVDDSQRTFSRVTWRAAVEFDVAERSLLYASVESGFRSGGFSPATGFETFEPETITAYTLGMKNRFFDNKLQLNVEAFWWDYRNQQVSAVRDDLDGRTANITQNVGQSRIRGFEVESSFLLTPTTLVSGSVQYLDTVNQSFVYQQANTGTPPLVGCAVRVNTPIRFNVDCSGLPAFNSPKWTVNLAAQQTIPVGIYKIVLQGDTQFRTSRYAGFAYLDEQLLPSFWRTNAQVSFGPDDDRWQISAFVRNIEDNRVLAFSSTTPLANALVAGTSLPRTYGVRAAVRF